MLGAGGAALVLAGIQSDRKSRTCPKCGEIIPGKHVSRWVTVQRATNYRAGREERKLSCPNCGKVTRKTRIIPQYDGVDSSGNYYYKSSSSDYGGGSSDGGGGGGGDF